MSTTLQQQAMKGAVGVNDTQNSKYGERIDLEDIQEMINKLTEEMREHERNGRYIDAQTALMKMEAFQKEANKRFREQIKQKHGNERKEIEEAHLSEFNQFEEFWDKKMGEFQEEASKADQEMAARHQEELLKFEEELQRAIPARPKDTSEVLNLKEIERNLAKQREYIEAHKVQQKCLDIERDEQGKWENIRDQKIKNQLNLLLQKQGQEMSALRKRIASSQDEQTKTRATELERLIQKYQNIKKELELQQQMELVRLDKTIKTNGSVMRSSYGSKYVARPNSSYMNGSRMNNK